MDTGGLAWDLDASHARDDSLFRGFGLQLAGFVTSAGGQTPAGLGFLPGPQPHYYRFHRCLGPPARPLFLCFPGRLSHFGRAYAATGDIPGPHGNRHPSITPFEPYDAADRPLVIAAGNDALFGRLCAAVGRVDLAADPRYVSNSARTRHAEELKTDLEAVLRRQPAGHWIAVLEAAGVPCSLIQNVAEAVAHPQTEARNMVVRAGALLMAGNPIKIAGFADAPTRRPAPELNADGDRIRRELGGG